MRLFASVRFRKGVCTRWFREVDVMWIFVGHFLVGLSKDVRAVDLCKCEGYSDFLLILIESFYLDSVWC